MRITDGPSVGDWVDDIWYDGNGNTHEGGWVVSVERFGAVIRYGLRDEFETEPPQGYAEKP